MNLPDDQVHVYLLSVAALTDPKLRAQLEACLEKGERQRYQQMRSREAAEQYLLGRAGLRQLLAFHHPGRNPQDWRFSTLSGGRPILLDDAGMPSELSFNVTHVADRLAIALCRSAHVGIDLEAGRRAVDSGGIAARYFCSCEREMLMQLDGEARERYFLQLWTLKEASVKADGVGLAGFMGKRCFSIHDGRLSHQLHDQPEYRARHWQFRQYLLEDDLSLLALALQCQQSDVGIACRIFDWVPVRDANELFPRLLASSTV